MNNFVFPPKPHPPPQDPISFNRNFTANFMSNQLFQKKQSSLSSQSQIDSKTDFIAYSAEKPSSPNFNKQLGEINYKHEYDKLLERHRKKEEKFKRVLFEWQNELRVKESVIGDCQRQLERVRRQGEGSEGDMAGRELGKCREKLRECEGMLERSERAKRDLELQNEKYKRIISENQLLSKPHAPDLYDASKPKQYYVSKLIECENALRQREQKLSKLSSQHEIVHGRSQLQYNQKNTTANEDKMSLIKALNHKRIVEEDLNKTISRLSSEMGEMREGKGKVERELGELVRVNEGYVREIEGLRKQIEVLRREKDHQLVLMENITEERKIEVQGLKEDVERLNGIVLGHRNQIGQMERRAEEEKEKWRLIGVEKEMIELKYKEEKSGWSVRMGMIQKEIEGVRGELAVTRGEKERLERDANKERQKREELEKRLMLDGDSKTQLLEDLDAANKQILSITSQNHSLLSTINNITMQNTNNQQLINELSISNNQLSSTISSLNNSLTQQNSQIALLKDKLIQSNKQIEKLSKEINQLSIIKDNRSQELQNINLKNLKLEQQLEIFKGDNQHLESQISQNIIRIQQLTQQNTLLTQNNKQLQVLKQSSAQNSLALNATISVLQNDKNTLEQSLLKTQSQVIFTQNLNKQNQSTIESLTYALNTKSEQQNISNQQLINLQQLNQLLQQTSNKLKNDLMNKQNELNNKSEDFRVFGDKIEGLIVKLQEIQEENDRLINENGELKERIGKEQKDKKEKQEKLRELEGFREIIEQKLKAKDEIEEEVGFMKGLIQTKQEENQKQMTKYSQLEVTLKTIKQQAQSNAIRLSQQLLLLTQHQQQTQSKLTNASKLLLQHQAKTKSLQSQLKSSKFQSDTLIKTIKIQLQSSLSSNKQLSKKLDDLKRQKTELQTIVTALKEEIRAAKKTEKTPKLIKDKKETKEMKQKVETKGKSKSKGESELQDTKALLEKSKQREEALEKEVKELKFLMNELTEASRREGVERPEFQKRVSQLQMLVQQLTQKIQVEINQNEEKTELIRALEERIGEEHMKREQQNMQIQENLRNSEITEFKLKQLTSSNLLLQTQISTLQASSTSIHQILNYCILRQLLSLFSPPPPSPQPHKLSPPPQLPAQPSSSVQKHILQLISKIQWMQQNLNFINQQNNDLQNQLEIKDNQVFDLRKMVEKNEGIVKDWKGQLDRANKRIHKQEDLIMVLNDELVGMEIRIGNARWEQMQGKEEQEEFVNLGESIEDLVVQSIDFQKVPIDI